MAFVGGGAANALLQRTSGNGATSTGTKTIYFAGKQSGDTNAPANVMTLASSGENERHWFGTDSDGTSMEGAVNWGWTTAPLTDGTADGQWWHYAFRSDGDESTVWAVSPDGTDWTTYRGTLPQSAFVIAALRFFDSGDGERWPGKIAHIRMWDAELDDVELAAEARSASAIRAANLVSDHRGVAVDLPTALAGEFGAAFTAPNGGISLDDDEPPLPLEAIEAGVARAVAAGLPAHLSHTASVAAVVGVASARGSPASLSSTAAIPATRGAAQARGRSAAVSATVAIVSGPARAVSRGLAAVVGATVTVAATVGRAVAAGLQTSIAIGGAIAVGVGRATASGRQASISLRETLDAGTGAALARGLPAVLGGTLTIAAATGTALASGLPATISTGGTIECGTGTAIGRGPGASVSQYQVIVATTARARAVGLSATMGEPTMGPYRVTLTTSQRGASIAASTRGATITRLT